MNPMQARAKANSGAKKVARISALGALINLGLNIMISSETRTPRRGRSGFISGTDQSIGRLIGICMLALTFLVALPLSSSAQAAPASRPNLIVILTDDQRWDALGLTGNPVVKTPNIDRLA